MIVIPKTIVIFIRVRASTVLAYDLIYDVYTVRRIIVISVSIHRGIRVKETVHLTLELSCFYSSLSLRGVYSRGPMQASYVIAIAIGRSKAPVKDMTRQQKDPSFCSMIRRNT
jgi:hypothetical protein